MSFELQFKLNETDSCKTWAVSLLHWSTCT